MSATGIGYASALAVAALFVVAAVGKARDLEGTAASFAALGVPTPSTLARVVPAAEVLIAAALVLVPPIGAAAAIMTLAFFTTFLAGRLRAGVRAPCACFGALTAEPLSVVKLVDNGFLFVLAAAAMVAPRPLWPNIADLGLLALVGAVAVAVHVALGRSRRAS